jgi:hypothetical protein
MHKMRAKPELRTVPGTSRRLCGRSSGCMTGNVFWVDIGSQSGSRLVQIASVGTSADGLERSAALAQCAQQLNQVAVEASNMGNANFYQVNVLHVGCLVIGLRCGHEPRLTPMLSGTREGAHH